MDRLLTTKQLIRMLQERDQDGDKVVKLRIVDAIDGDTVAGDELYESDIDIDLKFAQLTAEGDVDTVRITVSMDIN